MRSPRRFLLGCFGISAIVFVAGIYGGYQSAMDDTGNRLVKAKAAVKTKLEYPSEAEFSWGMDERRTSTGYIVSGRVKIQNAFGARFWKTYSVKFDHHGRPTHVSIF